MAAHRSGSVEALLQARSGHFCLESGYHAATWIDLERLCLQVEPVQRFAAELAARLAPRAVDAVCGPLIEGAFVALFVAAALRVPFTYAHRRVAPGREGLFPVRYRIPDSLRVEVDGRRVAVVNDVISAGSAVKGTIVDLEACGAQVVAIGTLAVLGAEAATFAARKQVPLETLTSLPYELWTPADCPLCAKDIALTPTPDY